MGASGQTVGPLVLQAPQALADAGQVLSHRCDLSLGRAQIGLSDLELGLGGGQVCLGGLQVGLGRD